MPASSSRRLASRPVLATHGRADKLLTTTEAADYLRGSKTTLFEYIRQGLIHPHPPRSQAAEV
jgi:fermentation-respiration switch protein FrsA (DUF1100 family)